MDRCWRTPRVPTQFFSQMMQLLRIILCPDPMVDLRIEIPNPLNSTSVRCTFDARFKHSNAIDQSIPCPWMWLSILMGGLWDYCLNEIDIGGDREFGKIRFDVCWLRMTDIYCRPDLNQCQLIYLQSLLQIAHHLPTSEILWTCWQNLIW